MTTANRYPDLFARLVAHVEIDPHTDCWTWTGPTRRHGGGERPSVSMRPLGEKHPVHGTRMHARQHNAARLMCTLVHGEPECGDLEASHLCPYGNWLCVCPDHLVWETKHENIARREAHRRDERALDLSIPCERPGTLDAPW